MEIPEGILFYIEDCEQQAINFFFGKDIDIDAVDTMLKSFSVSLMGGAVGWVDYVEYPYPDTAEGKALREDTKGKGGGLPHPDGMAMLTLAICRSLRNNTRLEPWDLFAAGKQLEWNSLVFQYPEMTSAILRKKQAKAGKGNSHADRESFKADYRAERRSFNSRDACIKSLQIHYPDPSLESMRLWSKQVDLE